MKMVVRRFLFTAAFVVGLAAPLAATWTPAQAFSECSLLSGHDSWSETIAGSGTYTVTVDYAKGVTVSGTPPPLTSLPRTLTSQSGHRLRISAVPAGGNGTRFYEGMYITSKQETCACANLSCSGYGDGCEFTAGMFCQGSGGGCTSTTCGGGGGSCSGGVCRGPSAFKAAH